jgi:hypothetical protein
MKAMKYSKYIAVILAFMFVPAISLQAQDTVINRNVQVEREYRPVIHDAGKIKSMPEVLEPNVEKTPVKYNDFDLPVDVGNIIHTLPAAELSTEKPMDKEGFARVGFGNYLNTLFDFIYPVVNTPDMDLDFSLHQLGTFETKRMHTTENGALSFDKIFKTVDLYANLGGGHEYFKYYGNNYNSSGIINLQSHAITYPYDTYTEINRAGINSASRTFDIGTLSNQPADNIFWRFNSNIGVRSLPYSSNFRYSAEVNYNIFNSVNGINENRIHTKGNFSLPIARNRLGFNFDVYNMMYSSIEIPAFNFWNSYSVLNINPYYSIERENWNIRLGLKSAFSLFHGQPFNPSADVLAEWKPFPKVLWIYGGINGDYEVNTLDKISSENPFIFSDLRVNDTYTPLKLIGGIKLKPLYNLLLNAFVDYRQIDNQYFFVNKEYDFNSPYMTLVYIYAPLLTNRFNVIYSNATLFRTGVRASYNLQDFLNIELKGTYNGWNVDTEQYAWNKPKYEAELNTTVKINPNLSVSANACYQGERYAKLGKTAVLMNDKIDINLGISYSYLNWLTVFGKINNLINDQYQDFYGYDVQGTNVMIGAAFKF